MLIKVEYIICLDLAEDTRFPLELPEKIATTIPIMNHS
jgi:hypothetical protein